MQGSPISKLKERLISCGLATPTTLLGCIDSEIEQVRIGQKVRKLPDMYKCFLREMGRQAGEFLIWADFLYPTLIDLKDDTSYDLELTEQEFRIPADAFVFMNDQGHTFYYFYTDAGDDPAVYRYFEGRGTTEVANERFSLFLDAWLDELGCKDLTNN